MILWSLLIPNSRIHQLESVILKKYITLCSEVYNLYMGVFWCCLCTWSRSDKPDHCYKKILAINMTLCGSFFPQNFSIVFMVKPGKIYSKWLKFPFSCYEMPQVIYRHIRASVKIHTAQEMNRCIPSCIMFIYFKFTYSEKEFFIPYRIQCLNEV